MKVVICTRDSTKVLKASLSLDTGGGETNFQTQPKNVDYTTKPKLLSTTDFGPYFTRGCKWSPDGLCILVCSDDHNLRIFDLPPNDKLEETKDQSDKLAKVSISSCQQNLMKTYHNEANTSGITKIASKIFLEFFEQSK